MLLLFGDVTITCKVLVVDNDRVRLGFAAPEAVTILRREVYEATRRPGGGEQTCNPPQ